jgi:hypothetical protein
VLATLLVGYVFLLSTTFRGIIAAIPQHWLIGIQTFRILGGVFLIRYFQGQLPGLFAIPAGVGDVLAGAFAPLVAYWWYAGKPYARGAAIAYGRWRRRNRISRRAHTDLCGAAFVPRPLILALRLASQNVAAAKADGVAALRNQSPSRMISFSNRCAMRCRAEATS